MIVSRKVIIEKFFDPVVVHFPLGRSRPKDKFLDGLIAALIADRVSEAALDEAAFLAISNHRGPLFPAVARCREFCAEARSTLRSAGRADASTLAPNGGEAS